MSEEEVNLPLIDPTIIGQILDTQAVGFSFPAQIVFGYGVLNRISFLSLFLKSSNAFIICDPEIEKLGYVRKVQRYLKLSGLTSTIFNEIEPNPNEETVIKAVESYKNAGCDLVIAIGGGSAIDVGKVVRLLAKQGGKVSDYDASHSSIMSIHELLPPQISIPTTSGTGSEVSIVAMITSEKEKITILGYPLISTIALVDPELTMSCPPRLTAYCGMDALTHAIESFISLRINPVADMFSLQAITLIAQNLKKVYENGNDAKARINMSLAALEAGMAFNQKSVGLVHAMSHQLSAKFNLPHGLANAVMLSTVLKFNKSVCKEKYATMGIALGLSLGSIDEGADRFIQEIEKLISALSIPNKLRECGVKESEIPEMAKMALKDISIITNPLQPITQETVEKLYREAY